MKIWFISDTHCEHRHLVPPVVDLVIHCGDESNHVDPRENEREAREFFEWYQALSIPTKIFVPGNHSTAIEKELIRPTDYPTIKFLIHEETTWMGFKIFGSPFTPKFFDWAYMKPREDLDAIWQTIPDDVDILITHGPPKGYFDVTRDYETGDPVHVGSKSLCRHVLKRIKPQLHAFGHIHDERDIQNFGIVISGTTQFVNCSVCDNANRFKNNGHIVEVSVERLSKPLSSV